MAPHYGGRIVFMLNIVVLVFGSRGSVFDDFHFYLFLSYFSSPSIDMKNSLPFTNVAFSSYFCYLLRIYTDHPNRFTYKHNHLSPITFRFFHHCRWTLFLLAAVSSVSLSPSTSSDILSPRLLLKVSNLDRELWRTALLLIRPRRHTLYPLAWPSLVFFHLKMHVRTAKISRQPQHTHQSCDVRRAAKFCPPVPIIWAVAL